MSGADLIILEPGDVAQAFEAAAEEARQLGLPDWLRVAIIEGIQVLLAAGLPYTRLDRPTLMATTWLLAAAEHGRHLEMGWREDWDLSRVQQAFAALCKFPRWPIPADFLGALEMIPSPGREAYLEDLQRSHNAGVHSRYIARLEAPKPALPPPAEPDWTPRARVSKRDGLRRLRGIVEGHGAMRPDQREE